MSGGIQTFRLKTSVGQRGPGTDVVIILNYEELYKRLKSLSKKSPDFNRELRVAAQEVAQHVVDRAKTNASGQPKHGPSVRGSSGRSQAQVVVNGLRARRDRIPTIKLDHNKLYPSKSRNNRSRGLGMLGPARFGAGESSPYRGFDRKVTYGDVFFGAEFGGRRRKTTQQFLRHRGRQGYFFWQAVRDSRSYIAKEYVASINRVMDRLGIPPE
jgi:hypothetical protein